MARINRLPKPLRYAALAIVAIVVPGGIALVTTYIVINRRAA
jgi:hypothetical protein